MALKNYHALVGKAVDIALDDDSSPHIEIKIDTGNQLHRIAVNVRSSQPPHALLYRRIDPFEGELANRFSQLSDGLTEITGPNSELKLDYVRDDHFERDSMQIAPFRMEGPNNDLREHLIPLIESAISDDLTRVVALGEAWGPESDKPDKYFGFLPGRGIHDIHMNQGSRGRFRPTNGANQDGALFFHVRNPDRWIAIFLAFQSQTWETDPNTGHPISDHLDPRPPIDRNPSSDATVQIVAAMVNAPNPEEGRETVTVLNRADGSVDLTGWRLIDKNNRKEVLDGRAIGAGETLRITLSGEQARLGNSGGELQLVDSSGDVAHAISYKKADVPPEGWTVLF